MILQMRGKSNTQGLLDLINYIPNNLTMAEVGCYAGESTKLFLESNKITKLYAIDIWNDEIGNFVKMNPNHDFLTVERIFDENMSKFSIEKLKMNLQEALKFLPPLDFIYIDANHDYEFIKDDINNALKIMKTNGIVSGHDYNSETPGVIRAVNEFFGEPDLVFSDSSWLVKLK